MAKKNTSSPPPPPAPSSGVKKKFVAKKIRIKKTVMPTENAIVVSVNASALPDEKSNGRAPRRRIDMGTYKYVVWCGFGDRPSLKCHNLDEVRDFIKDHALAGKPCAYAEIKVVETKIEFTL